MILLALLLQSAPPPLPYRPAGATIMAEPVAMMLAGFDADGDARVTRKEAEAGVARSFGDAADMGYIAFADWATRWLGDANAVPGPFEVDRNGDNHITPDELQARFTAIFDRLDKDKDGVLTHAELLTIRANTFGGRPDDRDGRDGRPPRRR